MPSFPFSTIHPIAGVILAALLAPAGAGARIQSEGPLGDLYLERESGLVH